jgi:hypothetical protein
MKRESLHPQRGRPGPAPFACCYLNECPDLPPLLLALESAPDIAGLLDLAAGSLVDVAGRSESIVPKVAFRPDGTVVPKVTKCSSLPPGTVLVFGSGEPFNAASVPARAKRLNLTQQRRQRDLGPLVRAPQTPRQLCRASPGIHPRLAEPLAEPIHDAPWKFSPSGRWESPLALRPDRL